VSSRSRSERESGADALAPDRVVLIAQRWIAGGARRVEQLLVVTAGVLLLYLSVVLFLQVLYRYVLQWPLPWSEESARFAMVWFGMLAAGVAAYRGLHFNFRWGILWLSPVVRLWLRQVLNVATIALLAVVYVQSLRYLEIVANQTAPGTELNMRIPHASVTGGAVGMLIIYACEVLDAICSVVTGQTLSIREHREALLDRELESGPIVIP
jgi:TRAP-type C4-dicarboxylate transport system permease small subunit